MTSAFARRPQLLLASAALMLAASAAHADATVYGLIDLSYGKNQIAGDKKADFHSGGDRGGSEGNSTTKFGLKGSADVGSGLTAKFQLESSGIQSDGDLNKTDDKTNPLFGRQAWAGLAGAFGEVRLGVQDSVAFETAAPFDLNGAANAASALFNAGVSPALGAGRKKGRELQYFSPDLGGVKIIAAVQPAGEAAAAAGSTVKTNYGLGITYTAGPLAVAVSGESKPKEADENFTSFTGSYDFGVAKAMVGYGKRGTSKGPSFGVVAPVAGFNIGLQMAKNTGTEVKTTELFVNREVLKNTTVYLDLGTLKAPNVDTKKAYALGVIYAF